MGPHHTFYPSQAAFLTSEEVPTHLLAFAHSSLAPEKFGVSLNQNLAITVPFLDPQLSPSSAVEAEILEFRSPGP